MKCIIVSHTHWDREWYRTFQTFRARLVDTIDRVLELLDRDPGFRFLLDGQTIVLDDYLEIRPDRRDALASAVRAGRIAIGPWYVQPDSLLPSGEAHIRNLLEGRRGGSRIGPVSRIAYTPDSFGHPAQFPQLFRGFDLQLFVYWRGNGNEIDALPSEYIWEAPDGSGLLVHHLGEGYFAACGLPTSARAAAQFLESVGRTLAERTYNDCVLLMNGIDHAMPEPHVGAVAETLAQNTGWSVQRGLLEDFAGVLSSATAPRFRGELTGARIANLLAGVWSTRLPLKLRNRRIETLLEGWAEPWSALGRALGLPDERPALHAAWRALLQNQAHDSICGCSLDRVHQQMQARYDSAEELATVTTQRVLERLAGSAPGSPAPGTTFDIAVFNPSPHPRTDVVRFALEPANWFSFGGDTAREMSLHPWLQTPLGVTGFSVDGKPARLITDETPGRLRLTPDLAPHSLEVVVTDVPAFGWRRLTVAPSPAQPEREDDQREIACGDVWVRAPKDGTFELRTSKGVYTGLCGIEDVGDRGDTYDFDPVADGTIALQSVDVRRRSHVSGVQYLTVRRTLSVPTGLAAQRQQRSAERVDVVVETEARIAPGVDRVDVRVRCDNTAKDHRLRLLFPTRRPVVEFEAATTFDVARRHTGRPDETGWVHPAPTTFVQQGFVRVNGLTVGAPGLPEAEVTPDGVIAITLVRAVGWLARMDLRTRPQVAGPVIETPGAQCLEPIEAQLALFVGADARAVRDAELGLRAVLAGATPLFPPDRSLLAIAPHDILLSALKPAEDGLGIVVRLLNPTDASLQARICVGFPIASWRETRLDERPIDTSRTAQGDTISISAPPHALRSYELL